MASTKFPGNLFINVAVMCLINAERTKRGLSPVVDNPALTSAAQKHTNEAVRIKWWGKGADPHVNPETHSTVETRVSEAGYCPTPRRFYKYSEIAYTDGDGKGTPREAVNWWMNVSTGGHREIILDPQLEQIGIGTWGAPADRNIIGEVNPGTYVVDFGTCHH
ncbi:CAP domain-containing protein [Streptomyces sp. SID1328]|uniref:CAP domain-containing protein n=1 Tax=Streptomyces sp. SID1328 TaxID=2690250 RepID=UPI0031F76785